MRPGAPGRWSGTDTDSGRSGTCGRRRRTRTWRVTTPSGSPRSASARRSAGSLLVQTVGELDEQLQPVAQPVIGAVAGIVGIMSVVAVDAQARGEDEPHRRERAQPA